MARDPPITGQRKKKGRSIAAAKYTVLVYGCKTTTRDSPDFPDLRRQSQSCTDNDSSEKSSSKDCDGTDGTVSILAESVHLEKPSSSELGIGLDIGLGIELDIELDIDLDIVLDM